MKRLLTSFIFTVGLSIARAGTPQISLEDILFLTQRGVSDETMLVFIKTREIGFIPDADDIDKLLLGLVSEKVIRQILRQTATYSAPSYRYPTTTYVDLYPRYYYTPYYSGTSVFLGYSSYPHTWYGNHYNGVHYTSLHRGAAHYSGYNDYGSLTHSVHRGGYSGVHTSALGLGHNPVTGIRHDGARSTVGILRHSTGRPGHFGRKNYISHSRYRTAHSRRYSAGHSSRGIAHRGGHSIGHSGGHSGGHGGGH